MHVDRVYDSVPSDCSSGLKSRMKLRSVCRGLTMRKAAMLLDTGVLISSVVIARGKPADENGTFEVLASKSNKSGITDTRWGRYPGGRWFMLNMAAAFVIRQEYPTKVDEVIGAPAWVMSVRFDIDARATFVPTVEQERMMLRALLADRFKFAAHYQTQERPTYNLVMARGDGRSGLNFDVSIPTVRCTKD